MHSHGCSLAVWLRQATQAAGRRRCFRPGRSLALWLVLLWASNALPTAHGAWGAFATVKNDCSYSIEGTTSTGDSFNLVPGEESQTFTLCESWCTGFLGLSCGDYEWSYQANMVDYPDQTWDNVGALLEIHNVSGISPLT